MNKDRYDDLSWFDEIEAAAHKDPSWERPAPGREPKSLGIIGKIIRWISK